MPRAKFEDASHASKPSVESLLRCNLPVSGRLAKRRLVVDEDDGPYGQGEITLFSAVCTYVDIIFILTGEGEELTDIDFGQHT